MLRRSGRLCACVGSTRMCRHCSRNDHSIYLARASSICVRVHMHARSPRGRANPAFAALNVVRAHVGRERAGLIQGRVEIILVVV